MIESGSNLQSPPYIGRFAPSPSGPLHFGSLVAALGSYLQAHSQQGRWLLRIEDIDPLREVAGAADAILNALETYGFEWDGPVTYQSQRHPYYEEALSQLRDNKLIYACNCSRKTIAAANIQINANSKSQYYPGTCRNKKLAFNRDKEPCSLRLYTEDRQLSFTDAIQGQVSQNIAQQTGDIVLFRRDGFYAYALAVSIDDMQQGITEVVRGCDLLNTTASQIYLMQQLSGNAPGYAHLPVVNNATGEKLSKQTGAQALPLKQPTKWLYQALRFLGQSVPPDLKETTVDEFWHWARQNWQLKQVPLRSGDTSALSGLACLNR